MARNTLHVANDRATKGMLVHDGSHARIVEYCQGFCDIASFNQKHTQVVNGAAEMFGSDVEVAEEYLCLLHALVDGTEVRWLKIYSH